MSKIVVKCTPSYIQSLGSSSLFGYVLKENNYALPDELALEFPQTTRAWKKAQGKPFEFTVIEHNIPLLMKDILSFIEAGVKVSVYMPQEETK